MKMRMKKEEEEGEVEKKQGIQLIFIVKALSALHASLNGCPTNITRHRQLADTLTALEVAPRSSQFGAWPWAGAWYMGAVLWFACGLSPDAPRCE